MNLSKPSLSIIKRSGLAFDLKSEVIYLILRRIQNSLMGEESIYDLIILFLVGTLATFFIFMNKYLESFKGRDLKLKIWILCNASSLDPQSSYDQRFQLARDLIEWRKVPKQHFTRIKPCTIISTDAWELSNYGERVGFVAVGAQGFTISAARKVDGLIEDIRYS